MSNKWIGDAIDVLLVEDNQGDARLVKEAMRDSEVPSTVHHVQDGEEAMAFLRRQGKYSRASRPHLILLDLNLPRKDGRETLAEIKADDDFKRIPVVILTVSSAEEDVLKSYNLHADWYFTKPIDLEQFLKIVRSIKDFRLTTVKLPGGSE